MGDTAGQLADGLHLLRLRQSPLAFPQRFLDMSPVTDVVDHTSEIATALRLEFADRQVQRECRPVLAAATYLSTDADDFPDASADVVRNISIMLAAVRFGHQHLHVLADELRYAVAEQALGGRVNAFDHAQFIDCNDRRDGRFQNAPELCCLRCGRWYGFDRLGHDGLPAAAHEARTILYGTAPFSGIKPCNGARAPHSRLAKSRGGGSRGRSHLRTPIHAGSPASVS